jgi:alpha-1,2-mannosyltransferase
MESWGTMKLAWQALHQSSEKEIAMMPHVFVDTTGCAFTFIVATVLYGCQVMAYVHYPTISTDMLQLVWQRRRSAYNHADYIAKSSVTTYIKLVYYSLFAVLYGMVGSLASVVMVNSTWTKNHIASLWRGAAWRQCIHIVYPPCNVESFQNEKDNHNIPFEEREAAIVSIGQFRPEKDHVLQIQAMAMLLQEHPNLKHAKLVLIGSCRGADDEARLEYLRQLAASPEYQLNKTSSPSHDDRVAFVVNQKYTVIQDWLQRRASVGIHTMWNEHFGIGIVEMMAAGLLVVAHHSGGPQTDIVVPLMRNDDNNNSNEKKKETRTGFLATTCEEYAQALHNALTMDQVQSQQIRTNARMSSQRFSDHVFAESFERIVLESKLIL